MSRPDHAPRRRRKGARPGAFAAAVSVALTGFGFSLALGWLWFPVLRDVLLPGLFAGTPAFRPLVFALAFGAGCLPRGFICGRSENGTALQQGLNAVSAHGFCLVLLGLAALWRSWTTAPEGLPGWLAGWLAEGLAGGLSEVLAGLALSLPGVWWFSRLLALGPGPAVAALAWAALAAPPLSIPLARPPGWPPDEWNMAFAALCAGVAAGLVVALLLLRLENRKCSGAPAPLSPPEQSAPDAVSFAALPAVSPAIASAISQAWPLGVAALLFFGLGSLNVSAREPGAFFPAIAHACGLILAARILNVPPGALMSRIPERETDVAAGCPDGARLEWRSRRALLAGACGLAFLSALLPLFSPSAWPLFALIAALPEAASLVLCSAASGRAVEGGAKPASDPAAPFKAGLTLIVLLAAVNAGYLAGTALAERTGGAGPALPGLAAAVLLGLIAYRSSGRIRAAFTETGGPAPFTETGGGPPPLAERTEEPPEKTVWLRPALAGQLTEKELALAVLLVRGYSNKELSKALSLSENTVRWYIKKLNKKTGATDRQGLIAALKAE